MPAQEIARQWFIPGDGIDRHVISADIQRYLGNDATVRPGQGTGENQGVNGYWIKAYRNLTSAMIADLRADSSRWRQEQRATGTREPYVGSNTYQASSAATAARQNRRDGDSPSLDAYGVPTGRSAGRRQPDNAMDIDVPMSGSSRVDPRYAQPAQPARGYDGRDPRGDPRGYQPEQPRYSERGQFPQDQPMSDAYARPPVSQPYDPRDPRYASNFGQPNEPPAGYARGPTGNYFVGTSGYDMPSNVATSRDPQQFPTGMYGGGPPAPQYREARDPRDPRERDPRDPRYAQPEYDPTNAYPSPATTVASVPRGREAITNPPQNIYGGAPQYDQYGRAIPSQPYGQDPGFPSGREQPSYGGGERRAPAPSGGDARRRRH